MEDYGSRYAESRLRILDAKLRRVYRQAEKELEEKLKQFSEKKKKKNALLLKKVKDGEISEQQYKDWLAGQAFIEKQWKQKVEQATALMQHANEEALAIVRGEQLNVFAENANYQAYELEQDFRGAYSFNIYDKKTVENLVTNKPELLPPKKVNGRKDRAWNQGIIANCVTQGIIQGESIDKITKRIAKDTASHDMKAMRRYARTAMTSAQNAGRMEVLNRAQDMGIKVQKQWLSAHDSRTRDSHRMLDGDIKDINKPFHGDFSDIMYPGDPSAHPAEVYNCRCRMTYVYPDYQKYDTDQDWRDREVIDGQSYEQWKEGKKTKGGQETEKGKETEGELIKKIRGKASPEESISGQEKVVADIKKKIESHVGDWSTEELEELGKISTDYINSLTETEIEKAKAIQRQAKERTDRMKELYKKKENATAGELVEIDTEREKLFKERSELRDKSNAIMKEVSKKSTQEFDAIYRRIREVGGVTDANIREYVEYSIKEAKQAAIESLNYYPTDWLKQSAHAKVTLKARYNSTGRCSYSQSSGKIFYDGLLSTGLHEDAHRFEHINLKMLESEKEFYNKRTKGCKLEWLGSGFSKSEKTRRDSFVDSYMGKDYDGKAFELASMGYESLFQDFNSLDGDKEMRDWLIGMLFAL